MRPSAAEENARNEALEQQGRASTGFHGVEGQGEQHYTSQWQLGKITGIACQIQLLTITATGGTFTITFAGKTTAAIAYNSSEGFILFQLANIGAPVSMITGNGPFTITFSGVYPLLTVDNTLMTGGTAAVTAVIPGWYTWMLLREDGQLATTGAFTADYSGFSGPDANGSFAAYEERGNASVPVDGTAVVRLWPGEGGAYLLFAAYAAASSGASLTVSSNYDAGVVVTWTNVANMAFSSDFILTGSPLSNPAQLQIDLAGQFTEQFAGFGHRLPSSTRRRPIH